MLLTLWTRYAAITNAAVALLSPLSGAMRTTVMLGSGAAFPPKTVRVPVAIHGAQLHHTHLCVECCAGSCTRSKIEYSFFPLIKFEVIK